MTVRWNVKPDNDNKEGFIGLDYRVKPDNDIRGGDAWGKSDNDGWGFSVIKKKGVGLKAKKRNKKALLFLLKSRA